MVQLPRQNAGAQSVRRTGGDTGCCSAELSADRIHARADYPAGRADPE